MTTLAVVDCWIGNTHPTTGCHGMNAALNDLTTVPLGRTVLHVSLIGILSLAATVWAFVATRSEARYLHTSGGERNVFNAWWLTGVLGALAAVWIVLPEQGFQLFNAVWMHLGGHA
jgi:hypothetical protein